MNEKTEFYESQYFKGFAFYDCPYLPGRSAKFRMLADPHIGEIYRDLLDAGFRRSGIIVYRPDCEDCTECRIIKIRTADFRLSRSQKRVLQRGDREFRFETAPLEYSPVKKLLLEKYLLLRHERTESDLEIYWDSIPGVDSFETQLWHGDTLAGVGIVDFVEDVLSSVYFFFDPDFSHLSPGTYSVIKEIHLAAEYGLEWYYPGFYIRDCASMNYKANFRPHILVNLQTGREEYAS